jgi:GNAT superfamily N-acetyltransferase
MPTTKMPLSISISQARESDVETLYQLTVALAAFERKTPDQISVTREKLRRWAFGPNRVFEAIIARNGEEPVGMAVYSYIYAGSMGAPILYFEDLFVLRQFRGQGIGTKMLKVLARKALERGCCRMQWAVFEWNENAIKFYEKLGATIRRDLPQVRMEAADIIKLSKEQIERSLCLPRR